MLENKLMVSICILTFNRCSLLRTLLGELNALTYMPLEIILVDNNSEDETGAMVGIHFPKVQYLRTKKNIGIAGRNIGMKAAQGDIIITLDDDVRGLEDKAIYTIVNKFQRNKDLGAINFRVIDSNGTTCNWVHHRKEEDFVNKEFLTYEITEGAVAFRRKALEHSGYYSEIFFLSHEGPDLAFRILEKGFTVVYSGEITVEHLFSEQNRQPWRKYYFDTRNQFWLAARNFPFSYAVGYLIRGLSSMLFYSIRDGYLQYWVKAIADGLRGLTKAMEQRTVLSKKTMDIIKMIDSQKPRFSYLIKKRILRKSGFFR